MVHCLKGLPKGRETFCTLGLSTALKYSKVQNVLLMWYPARISHLGYLHLKFKFSPLYSVQFLQ